MGLVEAFVVSYAGNLGYVYDLGTLIEAAALLAAHKDLIFLIVGEGVAKADLERQAQALNLRNVRFLPFQPAEDLPWLRATSDIQVSLHRPGTTGYSMPSKIYEIMASGRPLLASADVGSDVWQVVQTSGCGVCIEPGDATNLAQTILMLQRNPELRLSMSQHGRQYAEQSFSRQSVVERYHDLLQQITAPSSRSHHMPSTSA
jgi:glycosyltransferase involved in cell wall biosynthesis